MISSHGGMHAAMEVTRSAVLAVLVDFAFSSCFFVFVCWRECCFSFEAGNMGLISNRSRYQSIATTIGLRREPTLAQGMISTLFPSSL